MDRINKAILAVGIIVLSSWTGAVAITSVVHGHSGEATNQAGADKGSVMPRNIVADSVSYNAELFRLGQRSAYCSAVLIGEGKMLTAGHCVEQGIEDGVLIQLSNGKVIGQGTIKVLYTSPDVSRGDVALLYSNALEGLEGPRFGREKPQQGQEVFAYGSPYGFDFSLSEGYVSYVGRDIPMSDVKNELQLNMSVGPGNSGGPLFDKQTGALLGIVNARMSGDVGMSFAVGMGTICSALSCVDHADTGLTTVSAGGDSAGRIVRERDTPQVRKDFPAKQGDRPTRG